MKTFFIISDLLPGFIFKIYFVFLLCMGCMLFIPTLGRLMKDHYKVKASLVYIVGSRPASRQVSLKHAGFQQPPWCLYEVS